MAEIIVSGAAAGVAGSAVERAAPRSFDFIRILKIYFQGKTIMVVGPEGAGKTTFLEYFRYGHFSGERSTEPTLETAEEDRFKVIVGKTETLELPVKQAVDLSGQSGANNHANAVVERNPHAIVVMSNLTTPQQDAEAWLREFCRRLETKWRSEEKKNRLKTMIILLNKRDKPEVTDEIVQQRTTRFREIVDAELRQARGKMSGEVRILPCSIVENPVQTQLVDVAIFELVQRLAKLPRTRRWQR
jgi:GTPase SAR1 family protein